jgi:hypothetical protein
VSRDVPNTGWPPTFTLDQERILNLLTGDRFYSNPSAALREAVLNAIDAVQRRSALIPNFVPRIHVEFDQQTRILKVIDNGIGMSRDDMTSLFTRVGASAATAEAQKQSVGEFGIGVVSYFMAGDSFSIQTFDGSSQPVALMFDRQMLAGGQAQDIQVDIEEQGTSLTIYVRNDSVFELLVNSFAHWCRDVSGLSGVLLPEGKVLPQGGAHPASVSIDVIKPAWVERSHLGPVSHPTGWDAMNGASTVAVLYRGVFVQTFEVRGPWGIDGSIDVDPKHFKPRLNREGFVGSEFQAEVESFLRSCHPQILEAMVVKLQEAVVAGDLSSWNVRRWATLWLSVPRNDQYVDAVRAWDAVFRGIPAFELAVGNNWQPVPLEKLTSYSSEIYVAPLAEEQQSDTIQAAVRLLRSTGKPVVRGLRRDKAWLRYAPSSYSTTAELIASVFAAELPPLVPVAAKADTILAEVRRVAPLFTGPPTVDIVRLGAESPPALRLHNRLVINVDHKAGLAIVNDALTENAGHMSLITLSARHAHEQLGQVAAAVREITTPPEILSPLRRRYIRSRLQ